MSNTPPPPETPPPGANPPPAKSLDAATRAHMRAEIAKERARYSSFVHIVAADVETLLNQTEPPPGDALKAAVRAVYSAVVDEVGVETSLISDDIEAALAPFFRAPSPAREVEAEVEGMTYQRDVMQQGKARAEKEVARLRAWLLRIDGGDHPCTDEAKLRQWAYEAVTLGKECP